MRVIKQIHHALTGHYTSPNSLMMRNQVLWKNPYSQPIITFEESDGERDWVIDCSTQGYLFRRKGLSQGSHLRDGYFVCLVGESNKEQWYTNGCSYFLRSYPRRPVMWLWNIAGDGVTEASVVKVEWRVSGLHGGGEGGRPTGHSMWEGIGFVWTNDHGWQFFFCLVCLCYWAAEQTL